jgi:hypothetical protein
MAAAAAILNPNFSVSFEIWKFLLFFKGFNAAPEPTVPDMYIHVLYFAGIKQKTTTA